MKIKFLRTEMKKLLCQCFLTWTIYLTSESAQKLNSRWRLKTSLGNREIIHMGILNKINNFKIISTPTNKIALYIPEKLETLGN